MKKNKANLIVIAVFALLVLGLGAAIWLTPDQTFSENENRFLQTTPQINGTLIQSGKLDDTVEDYLADQFWARDSWTALRSRLKMLLQNRDIGGVYLADDGYYIEKFTENDLDTVRMEKNLGYLSKFFAMCGNYIPNEDISFLLVPTPGYILSDKLPPYATLFDQDAVFETVKGAVGDISFLDLRQDFLAEKEHTQLYYRTDHHWTSEGALYAYQLWRTAQGEAVPTASDFAVERYEGFRGTLYSKVLDAASAYDTVSLYRFPGDEALTVTYDNAVHSSCYAMEKLKQKNMYEVFFGGNYPTVEIAGGAQNGRHLLVVKDSYANSFLPFAAADYESITVIDLRYYLGSMEKLMQEGGITDVLVLYSTTNFLTDQNMSRLVLG